MESVVPNLDPSPPRPLAYHDRTGHVLADGYDCPVQRELSRIVSYCNENEMRINTDKTKVMMFSNSRKYDYMPQLSVDDSNELQVVEKYKLLGIVVQSDLRWYSNTQYMCERGYQRLWMLRRLRIIGANTEELVDVYQKQIRSIMEFAVPVWEPGLTIAEKKQIERVQKAAFNIILGEEYISYDNALIILHSERLSLRRQTLSLSFGRKALNDPKYYSWFRVNDRKPLHTRADKEQTVLKAVQTLTDLYRDSPLPYLTNMLNDFLEDKKRK